MNLYQHISPQSCYVSVHDNKGSHQYLSGEAEPERLYVFHQPRPPILIRLWKSQHQKSEMNEITKHGSSVNNSDMYRPSLNHYQDDPRGGRIREGRSSG